MKIKILRCFVYALSLILCVILTSCGTSYDTDFPPPDTNKTPAESFPSKIGDLTANVTSMNLDEPQIGFQCTYGGQIMTVQIVNTVTDDSANDYFKSTVLPQFEKMKTRTSAQVNGKWFASGTDPSGRIWYGWANGEWVYLITADSETNFKTLVDALPYIQEK